MGRNNKSRKKRLQQKVEQRKVEKEKQELDSLPQVEQEAAKLEKKEATKETEDEQLRKLKEHIAKLEQSEKDNPNIESPSMKEIRDRLEVLQDSKEAPESLKEHNLKGIEPEKWTGKLTGSGDAHVTAEGDISPEEQVKLQALVGNAKATNMKTYAGQKGVTKTLTKDDFDRKATLVFQGCSDCVYTLDYLCTKVFLQICSNFKLIIDKKVVTQTAEIYKCDNVTMEANKKIRTCQVDMSNGVNLIYKTRDNFDGVVWAGVEDISVLILDSGKKLTSGFKEVSQEYADLNIERSQFKIEWFNGNLRQDKLVRLDNGFPTTKREADGFGRKQEAAVQEIAKRMGITISRKKEDIEGPRVKRNDPCTCGSGRKYKKCCGK